MRHLWTCLSGHQWECQLQEESPQQGHERPRKINASNTQVCLEVLLSEGETCALARTSDLRSNISFEKAGSKTQCGLKNHK